MGRQLQTRYGWTVFADLDPVESGKLVEDMHFFGNEHASQSTRCSPTLLRAVECAATRNEYSGKAARTGSPYRFRWVRLCMSSVPTVTEED